MNSQEQLEAVARAKLGDEKAWADLYKQFAGMFVKFSAPGRWGNADIIESELHLYFLRAIRNYDESKGASVATHVFNCLSYGQKRGFEEAVSHGGPVYTPLTITNPELKTRRDLVMSKTVQDIDMFDAPAKSNEAEVEFEESKQLVLDNLEHLPLKHRFAIRERLKGATYKEISNGLGCTAEYGRRVTLQAVEILKELLVK